MTDKEEVTQQKAALKKLQDYLDAQQALIEVDIDDLNAAFCSQANLFFNASRRGARAEQILNEQKQYLDAMMGRKDLEIREGQAKTTEEFVKQALKRETSGALGLEDKSTRAALGDRVTRAFPQ